MDTPEKTQIGTPLSKFEDSPVFNYINSLSPIKPVKSIYISQTFNALSFASLPSVFTSPHVSSHKESRFLKRHNHSELSKPKNSSGNGSKVSTNEGAGMESQLYDNSAEIQEGFDQGVSIGEVSVDPPNENSRFSIELPQILKYDCGSPDCETTCANRTDSISELTSESVSLVPFTQATSGNGPSEKVGLQIEQKNGLAVSDWESLISDTGDLLIFSSPNNSEGIVLRTLNPSHPPQSDSNGIPEMQDSDQLVSDEQQLLEDQSTQAGETREPKELNQTHKALANSHLSNCTSNSLNEEVNKEAGTQIPFASEPVSNLHRGMRRRCLDFELVGARRKNLCDGSNCSSSVSLQSDEKMVSSEKQLQPIKLINDSSGRILPGIGLHLNALAIASRDNKNAKHENFSFERQLSLPSSSAPFQSLIIGEESRHESFNSASAEREMDPAEHGIHLAEDASQASGYLLNEELNQNSPKKKKRRLEQDGESEACKRCNCKKSKCLKLYCECFAAGVYCIEPCSCQDCYNKPIHEDTVLATRKQIESRNPLAFAPKVIRGSDSVPEVGDDSTKTPASARHKRGCNCKKSSCLKKYCECYQGGVGCSINCRCEGCKNAFGRKDGSVIMENEAEPEEEAEACEKSQVDRTLHKTEVQTNSEQNPSSAHPTTPLPLCRPLVQLPFSSKNRLPRSFLAVGSSSGLYTGQKYGKPNILRPRAESERHFQNTTEDEMPEILRANGSPSAGIKSSSPNSKRVSPPQCELKSSPSRRSGRKLILQSIPSFPSLTLQQ